MEYTFVKIDGQNLMYHITTQYNNKEITFNVVCANNETELDGLVQYHIDYLNKEKIETLESK